ncbi:hypothetical protein CQA57_06950 [Helicobacter anseris]|uniref:Uncharacterized protein n=1 Tax=Helicobacter anseris TaxID=375926 RepID=A0A3D8J4F8_9HELI|nr:hypothetical protein [Helicobacter anseris]RDU72333.1 hypothetical protein CQA57_06950 [Helicobacter anseris]
MYIFASFYLINGYLALVLGLAFLYKIVSYLYKIVSILVYFCEFLSHQWIPCFGAWIGILIQNSELFIQNSEHSCIFLRVFISSMDTLLWCLDWHSYTK